MRKGIDGGSVSRGREGAPTEGPPPGPAVPSPPWADDRRRTARVERPPLDRERIVTTGLRIVDAEGAAALSLRRLSGELDVAPMSLYWYVHDKAQLLDLIGEAVLESIAIPPATGSWKDDLRAVHGAMRDALDHHPNAADLMIGRARYGRAGLTLFEWILRILLGAGFSSQSAFAAYDVLYLFTLGYAATASRTPEFVAMQLEGLRYLVSLPEASFPAIHAVAGVIPTRASLERFETGLDVVIEGIDRTLGPGAHSGG